MSPKNLLATILMASVCGCGSHEPGAPSLLQDETAPVAVPPVLQQRGASPDETLRQLRGRIVIDGSSTVFPITETAVEAFRAAAPDVEIQLGVSGTGGGFRKFCRGETMLSDASRPIRESEQRQCRENGIELIEMPIAFDGITVVIHSDNHWARCLRIEELARLWSAEAEEIVTRWSDLRPEWPDEPIALYAPGGDSGTYDYFIMTVLDEEGRLRSDVTSSEDDYLIAQRIAKERLAMGFFGYAYYREYSDRLQAVEIDAGEGCIGPSSSAISQGTYRPLSRPLYVYASRRAAGEAPVGAFLDFFLTHARDFVHDAHYVPLPPDAYRLTRERLTEELHRP